MAFCDATLIFKTGGSLHSSILAFAVQVYTLPRVVPPKPVYRSNMFTLALWSYLSST